MKKLLLASAALMALSSAAAAADLAAAPVYTKAPVINPGVNWNGFYIGAMGGYGWSDHVRVTVGGIAVTDSTSDINGGFGGGTIGYNWQTGAWVFGLEADAAGADIAFSDSGLGATFRERIDAFGSVTGRIGYATGAALFYAKGGYAWADNEMSASLTGIGTVFSESHLHSGWTLGGGVEYMFTHNWSGKLEYMYADYDSETYVAGLIPGGIGFGTAVHTVKAGINYHF
ncbi:MAG: porin family protein [Bradyrhizobium sp.]|nr:porin family protein [Bradyrhizobium sp.]